MLLGIINKKDEQIYIELKVKNNCNFISFNKVKNNKVINLDSNEAINIINELFNTEKKYLESSNGFDIYIDNNNLRRFYKDGIEDFDMFYLINGVNATLYKSKKSRSLSKMFNFMLGGVTATVVLSCYGPNILNSFFSKSSEDIQYTVDDDVYESVTVDSLEDYIYNSDGLSSFDKDIIFNEEYFSFLLDTVDDNRKIYDFNKRFDDINISRYDESVLPGTVGFYDNANCNTINVLDTICDEDSLKDVEAHELVHLTQCGKYNFIKEALAEIMSHEFYDTPYSCYSDAVKRVKVLIEIIGPRAVFNSVYSYNTEYFENSIKDLLCQKDAQDLLKLFYNYDYSGETNEATCERMDELLKKMLENKKKHCSYEEGIADEIIIASIMSDNCPTKRYYFNSNKEGYYKTFEVTTCIDNYDNSEENSNVEVPNDVSMSVILYTKDNVLNNINDDDFLDFIDSYDVLLLTNGESNERFFRKTYGKYSRETDAGIDDDVYDIKDILSNYEYKSVTFACSTDVFDFDEINNYKFLNNVMYCCLSAPFNDGTNFAIAKEGSLNNCRIVRGTVPSVYDKFGCVNPYGDYSDNFCDDMERGHSK